MTTYTLSIDAQICEHMAWELNQSGFHETIRAKAETDIANMSGPFGTVTRTYLPEYDHDMDQQYRVTIYPDGMVQSRISRSQFQENYQVQMVLHRRIDVGDKRTAVTLNGDKVMKFADQIRKWWEWGSQGSVSILNGTDQCHCAWWVRCAREPMFGLAEMSEYHVIFVPIVHTWSLIRTTEECVWQGNFAAP